MCISQEVDIITHIWKIAYKYYNNNLNAILAVYIFSNCRFSINFYRAPQKKLPCIFCHKLYFANNISTVQDKFIINCILCDN